MPNLTMNIYMHSLNTAGYAKWLSLLFTVLLSGISVNSQAEQADDKNWYEIELLIFSNNDVAASEEENWPMFRETWSNQASWELIPAAPEAELGDMLDLTLIDRSGEIQTLAESDLLNQPDPVPATPDATGNSNSETEKDAFPHFDQIREEDLQLADIAEKLAKSNDFHLLLHTGWRQQVVKDAGEQPVYLDESVSSYVIDPLKNALEKTPEEEILNTLLEESGGGAQAGQDSAESSTTNSSEQLENDIPVGPKLSVIHGTASIRMSRFLHFSLDLVYRATEQDKSTLVTSSLAEMFPMIGTNETETPKAKPDSATEELASLNSLPLNGFNLKTSRRIKTNELHFFDHPRYGVIVRLIPWKPPEITPEELLPQQTPLGSSAKQFQLGFMD